MAVPRASRRMEHSSGRPAAPAVGDLDASAPDRALARRVYDRWRRAAHAVGVVHTRVIMLAIYAVVVVPTGLLMRQFRDPLQLRPPAGTNWIPRRPSERSLDAARRQY